MHDFNAEIENLKVELERAATRCKRIGDVKIIVCIVGVLLFIYNREHTIGIGWCVFALLCILFIVLFVYHEKEFEQKEYLEARHQILNKYCLRSQGEWTAFKDTGEEFLSEKSYLERDLDIIGERSLYQYLCVANTAEGKKKLAECLMQQKVDSKCVEERKEAIKELIEKYDFRIKIETLGALSRKKCQDVDDEWYYGFIRYMEENKTVNGRVWNVCSIVMPIILFIILGMVYLKHLHYGLLVLLLLAQMAIAYYVSYRNRELIHKLNRFCLGIDNIIDMVQCIMGEQFDAAFLKKLQSEMNSDDSLVSGMRKLSGIKDKFSMQRNVYVHVFLQMLFMYDVHCVRAFENWKKTYGENLRKIYTVIGEIEALLSLSSIALNRSVTFSGVSDSKKPVFQAEDMYHPLIDDKKVVPNTIKVTKGVNIITGSNMSGKSTFMRTIGINLVLAYAGAPVCAKFMHISIMDLHTCMRVTDDVFLGRSSFYAEVLRIKSIVECSDEKTPMFIIIDEIFKGTNSVDRITGAKEIIKRLNKSHIILFVSTHDLEICSLIDNNEVQGNNYHFLETYRDNEIIFDYKIKNGKCNSRNAKYILKMAGLLER